MTAVAFSLSASPARVELMGSGSQVVRLRNAGGSRVVLDTARAGFALDLRGRPKVIAKAPARWLSVRPKRIALPAHGAASLTVTAKVPRGASPGDHAGLLLLVTRPKPHASVAFRLRLGVVVILRVPGKVVHHLVLQRLRIARRGSLHTLRVSLANRGNVTELLTRQRVTLLVRRRGRLIARLHPGTRELLPHTRGVLELRYRTKARGRTTVQVEVARPGASRRPLTRTFHGRL